MDEEEDDDTEIAIAATCLLLSCSALVTITGCAIICVNDTCTACTQLYFQTSSITRRNSEIFERWFKVIVINYKYTFGQRLGACNCVTLFIDYFHGNITVGTTTIVVMSIARSQNSNALDFI